MRTPRPHDLYNVMAVVLNTYNYRKWEKASHDYALAQARDLIQGYRNGINLVTYTIPHSKEVVTYTLMKVWQLLNANGIFLYQKVSKVKDMCRVRLDLSDIDDAGDTDSETSTTDTDSETSEAE